MSALGVWGAPDWAWAAVALFLVAAAAVAWSYWRSGPGGNARIKAIAAGLKAVGLAALALSLADPLLSGVRPRRGANIFAVVVDDSQSLKIHDSDAKRSRGDDLQRMLLAESAWQTRLGQDFDVRRLAFGTQLRAVDDFDALTFDGVGTSLSTSLEALARRFRGLPIAGILLMTDGNATDALAADMPWKELPPVYPVVIGDGRDLVDVSVERVSSTETNFESAPVTVRADVRASGLSGESIEVALYDELGKLVESQVASLDPDCETATVRFQMRPEQAGLSFFTVAARTEAEAAQAAAADQAETDSADDAAQSDRDSDEATLANNRRLVAVDRGGGPYRILYVGGRPNWEFKFLNRALADDDQLDLVGLLRIAKREPKFSFRNRDDADTNQLFEGFENPDGDAAESYDEPVIVRLNVRDEHELRDGFPRAADELYQYDAIVLDDVEAEFFTQDQLTLIDRFVSRRGGGLLMLGGRTRSSPASIGAHPSPMHCRCTSTCSTTWRPAPWRPVPPRPHSRGLARTLGAPPPNRARGSRSPRRDAAVSNRERSRPAQTRRDGPRRSDRRRRSQAPGPGRPALRPRPFGGAAHRGPVAVGS